MIYLTRHQEHLLTLNKEVVAMTKCILQSLMKTVELMALKAKF